MNWKSTIALVLLAGAAGAWFFQGDAWRPKLGMGPAHPETPPSAVAKVIDSITPADITSIKVTFASGEPLEVRRADANSPWTMPGNWPPRVPEVTELANTLGNIRARFHPEPLGDNPDLKPFGLAPEQKPIAVTLGYKIPQAGDATLNLLFGEPPIPEGETTFTRPAYARITTKDASGKERTEVLKLGPDVMPIVRRTADSYRRRQLFANIERAKVATTPAANPFGPPPPPEAPTTITLPGEDTNTITVSRPVPSLFSFDLSPAFTFTLKRVGKLPEPGILVKGGEPVLRPDRISDAWRMLVPAVSPVEPGRLQSVLVAVSDLWVDRFVIADEATFALNTRQGIAQLLPVPLEPPLATLVRTYKENGYLDPLRGKVLLDERVGFTPESPSVQVTLQSRPNEVVRVQFGGIQRVEEREETMTVPGGPPGTPPQSVKNKVPLEYRYARIVGNPQLFVVAADKFSELFATTERLVDPRVARFEPDEVQEVVIQDADGKRPEIQLIRKKGNPKSAKPEERTDRWEIAAKPNPLPGDSQRVGELLDRLASLRADNLERQTSPEPLPAARSTITITAREKRAENEPDAPAREYRLTFSNADAKRLLPVRVNSVPRVTLIDNKLGPDDPSSWIGSLLFPDTLSSLLERPTLAYRNRKLFDTANTAPVGVEVSGSFTLSLTRGEWRLTQPIVSDADTVKAGQLAQGLGDLRATEYLTESPTSEELASFGLAKPLHTAILKLDNGRSYTLEFGATRPGKPEVFARLDGGAVFALPSSAADPLAMGPLGLLPLKVWSAPFDQITSAQITRFGDSAKDSFTLSKTGSEWKITGPFTAPVSIFGAQSVLTALGTLTAERYQALTAPNPAEFGFEKPLLSVKLTYTERKPGATEDTTTTQTVIVGGTTTDGVNRFAKLDFANAPVFVVPIGFVAAAQTSPLTLPDKSLLSIDPARITSVRVATGKPEDTFTLTKDAAGKWKAEGATFAIDPTRLAELTTVAGRPRIARLAAYGDAIKWADYGLEKADTTITITTSGEKLETHTIALGNPDPTGSRFARFDDKPAVGVLPAPVVEALTRKRFDFADRTLLTFDPTTVKGITRTMEKEELELAPGAAAGWDILKPAKQKADAEFVDTTAESLGRLQAERVAAYGNKADVFKQYGLEPGAAVVTLTVGDKAEEKILRIGNPVDAAKPDGERYVAVDSAAPEIIVGVLPGPLANKLLSSPLAFRDRTLAKFLDVDKVVIERGDRKLTFAKVGTMWKVTEPLMADAEAAALSDLVTELGGLRAESWVGEKPRDLKKFGLDKPEARWTLSEGDKTVLVLLLGKPAADGRVPVTAEGKDLIGFLSPSMSSRLLAEYRLRKVWNVDAAQAEAVDVSLGDAKFSLQKAGPRWLDPAKPTDPIDVRVVNELVGSLGALRAERYAADKDADPKLFGLEKPEATISITGRMGQKATLEIGGTVGGSDGKQRYARVVDKDRSEVFELSAADTIRLTRDRAQYTLKK
jgi:hypothetical protein